MITMFAMSQTIVRASDHDNVNGQLWLDTNGEHINAHGGNILVSSQPGEGTRFLLSLPRMTAIQNK